MGVKVRKPKEHTSWCVVIDHEGQRKTKAVGSREAAERVKRELEARLALGGIASLEAAKPVLPTFEDYSKTWLRNLEQERKPSTAGFYSQYLRLYVAPRFGTLRLDAIERHRIRSSSPTLAPGSCRRTPSALPLPRSARCSAAPSRIGC